MKRATKRFLLAFVSLACVLAAGLALCTSSPFENWLADRIASAARARGVALQIDDLDVHPLSGEAELSGLVVTSGAGRVHEVDVDHLRLAIARLSLLRGVVRPLVVEAEGLRVQIALEESGTPGGFDPALISRLHRVRIAGGELVLGDRSIPFAVDAEGLRARLDGQGGELSGALSAGPLRLEYGGRPAQVFEELSARLNWRAPRLSVPRIHLAGALGQVDASAALRWDREGTLHFSGGARAEWQLEDVPFQALAGSRGPMSSRASFEGEWPGAWVVHASVDSRGPLEAGGVSLEEAHADLVARDGEVVLRSLRGTSRQGSEFEGWKGRFAGGQLALEGRTTLLLEELLDSGGLASDLASAALELEVSMAGAPGTSDLQWSASGEILPGAGEHPVSGSLHAEFRAGRGSSRVDGLWDGATLGATLLWEGLGAEPSWQLDASVDSPGGASGRELLRVLFRELATRGIEIPDSFKPDPRGQMAADVSLSGKARKVLGGEITARVERPAFSDTLFDLGEIRLDLGPTRPHWWLNARLARVDGCGVFVEAAGHPSAVIHLEVNARETPLSLARHFLAPGRLHTVLSALEGEVSGNLSGEWGPSGPELSFLTSIDGWAPAGGRGRLNASGRWSGDSLMIGTSTLQAPGTRASFSGELSLPGAAQRPFRADGAFEVSTELGTLLPPLGVADLRGRLEAAGHIVFSGEEDALLLGGSVEWSGIQSGALELPDGHALLSRGEDSTEIDARAGPFQLELSLAGESADPSLSAAISWDDLDLIGLIEESTGKPLDLLLSAWSSGEMRLYGALLDPASWQGEGIVRALDIDGPDVSSRLEQPVPLFLAPGGRFGVSPLQPMVLLAEPAGRATLHGWAGTLGEDRGRLELQLAGSGGLGVLEALDTDLVASGTVEGAIHVQGSLAEPQFHGTLEIRGGRVRHLALGTSFEDINASLELNGQKMVITRAHSMLGGGEISIGGQIDLDAWQPGRIDLKLDAVDVALSVPRGIWGRYDAELVVGGQLLNPEISGDIDVIAATYSRPLEFDRPFTERVRLLAPEIDASSFLNRVNLDLAVRAEDGVSIRNDMVLMESDLRLHLSGSAARPLMAGQVRLHEGGRFTFRDVDYELISGQLTLDDPRALSPRVRLKAVTELDDYQLRLELDASSTELDYRLSSAPSLPENAILMLLLTGQLQDDYKTVDDATSSTTDLGAAYFGTKLGEMLLAGPARRVLGINRFQIAPSTVSSEADPSARITVGKRIDDNTTVLYSLDLSSKGRDYYRLERKLPRNWRLSASREESAGVGADLRYRHRFGSFGVIGSGSDSSTPRLEDLAVTGTPEGFRVPSLRSLDLSRRQRLTRAVVLATRERLRGLLVREGYLEAQVEARRESWKGAADRARIVLRVTPGSRWEFDVNAPERFQKSARSVLSQLWTITQFRPANLREAERVLLDQLEDEGYAAAIVELGAAEDGSRRLSLRMDPGERVVVDAVRIEGADLVDQDELLSQILLRPGSRLGLGRRTRVFRPRLLQEDLDAVRTLYYSRGFLETTVNAETLFHADGESVDLVFHIVERDKAKLGKVQVVGDWPAELGSAVDRIGFHAGEEFLPLALLQAEQSLRGALDEAGYFEAVVHSDSAVDHGVVDVAFHVRAGRQAVVEGVEILGLARTKERLVQRRVALEAGHPLRAADISSTEHALFRLGLFSDVEVQHQAGRSESSRLVKIRVKEIDPFSLQTSVGYDTEVKLRASVALSSDNLWGMGRVGTIQLFGSSLHRGVRATLEDNNNRHGKLRGFVTASLEEEDREGYSFTSAGVALEVGLPLRDRRRWQFRYELVAHSFSNVTLDPEALRLALLDQGGRIEEVRLGSLTAFWATDRRDDFFLPKRGSVFRTDLGVWSPWLASEESFLSWNGQYALYKPRGEHFVLASSLRLGFAWPFGDSVSVPLSERYYAGGSNSIRGFNRDKIGPLDGIGGEALGGEARLIFNLEARFRLWENGWLVLFSDAGNVWLKTSDFDLGGLRRSAGVGLRYNTPVGALRFEYGFKLDRREGESPGRIHFSIGETF